MFSKKWVSYMENDATDGKIMIERIGDTFEMTLKAKKREKSTKRPTCRFAIGADTA